MAAMWGTDWRVRQEDLKAQIWTREVSMGMERLGTVLEGGLAWGVDSAAVGSLSLTLFLKNAPLVWAALSAQVQGPQTGGRMQSGALTKTPSHLLPTVLSRLGGRTCPSPQQE